jgi:monoamine oxidase
MVMRAPDKALIVGGGLAGLVTALHLQAQRVPFELVEARDRLGGRIFSADAAGNASSDGFDLGPSWFWPDMQPDLARLINELGLRIFRQHEVGDVLIQYRPGAPVERYPGGSDHSASARLAGGTGELISALSARLPAARIRTNTAARRITLSEQGCVVECVRPDGTLKSLKAARVVLAMPPRLLAQAISFEPELDGGTLSAWARTPTWMAPHAKFVAVYDRPFWREMGLSGSGRSMVGPLAEIHDATTASGQAALFGFVGIAARQRRKFDEASIVAAAVSQLTTMYGPLASTPQATLYKDWAADPLTATQDDLDAAGHPNGLRTSQVDGVWAGRLFLAGSEASSREPGYLAGAVDAAERAVGALVKFSNNAAAGQLTDPVGR